MADAIAEIADLVWSYPVVGLCLASALFFTAALRLVQLRALPHAISLVLGRYDHDDEEGNISHFQALCAALSGTIGIGNIAGVAIAIAVGGPGAVLWMWLTGLLGMATKFVECTLGTAYREVDPDTGEARGGPMFYIVAGLGPRWRPMALVYALIIAFAGFGFTCMFQSNQAAAALLANFGLSTVITGAALALLTGAVILGGIESIGRWAARIVPSMCLIYVGGAIVICVWHYDLLPGVLATIVRDGLTGEAAMGGALGSMIMWGVRRAVFSNEAGLGSASIAHAAVKTDEPVREGIVASLGPLVDTVIVSGATAFVIVLAGNYGAFKDGASASLEPRATAAAWSRVELAEVPADPERFEHHLHEQAVLTAEGSLGASDALTFGLPADAHERAGVRVAAVLTSGRVEATLWAADQEVSRAALHPRTVPGSEGAVAWSAQTLKLPGTIPEGAEFRLRLSPLDTSTPVFVVVPHLVDGREGIALSTASFDHFLPGFGSVFISVAGFMFALSTMITWSYYGEIASTWVFGPRAVAPYRVVFVALAFVGAVRKLELVISVSDVLVGLLVVPNALALLLLSPRVMRWSRDYFQRLSRGDFER